MYGARREMGSSGGGAKEEDEGWRGGVNGTGQTIAEENKMIAKKGRILKR